MSPPVAQMVLSAMKIVMGKDGTNEGIVLLCYICYIGHLKVFIECQLDQKYLKFIAIGNHWH